MGGQETEPRIIELTDPRAGDRTRSGGKAATLARLIEAGFPVPDGVVLTTAAVREILESCGHEIRQGRAEPDALPVSVSGALDDAHRSLDGGAVAVRSSAVAEDTDEASYAGQYESVLDVRGREELARATIQCCASAFSERVTAYRGTSPDGSDEVGMAVLIQRMVPADAAGVAFTADPVTGDRDRVRVSAVRGTGERLVGGEAVADEWVVTPQDIRCEAEPEGAVDADQVRKVADLARRVEEWAEAPQDVEWALADGEVHLLQARPITALPRPPEIEVEEGESWMKDTTHYPEPMTPLGGTVYLPGLEKAIWTMASEFGLFLETVEQRLIGWEVYGKPVPVGGKSGPPPPWWVMGILVRVIPALRRRVRTAREVVRSGTLKALPDRWEEEWKPELEAEISEFLSTDLSELDGPALEMHLERVISLYEKGQKIHFRLFIPYVVGIHELASVCRELLGWEAPEVMDLLGGLSEASAGATRALDALAGKVRELPEAIDVLETAGADVLERLERVDPGLAEAARSYLERYGHRVMGYDPGLPTLAEQPALFARLLAERVASADGEAGDDVEESRREQVVRAREALSDEEERARFDRALERAERIYPLRDENLFLTDAVPNGLIRRASLEMGRRIAGRGILARPGDVSWLELDELREAFRQGDGDGAELRDTVARRKAERAWVEAHPGPAYYGDPPPPPPDLRAVPEEARRINEALQWFMSLEYPLMAAEGDGAAEAGAADRTDEAAEPPLVRGLSGAPGRYTGPVRVVRSEKEFDRVRPGDVLVCRVTTPTWSVLFGRVGAVITDGGSPVAHAAIVAREHGIPAVVATERGTELLDDGQVVTVDGRAGVVREGASVSTG